MTFDDAMFAVVRLGFGGIGVWRDGRGWRGCLYNTAPSQPPQVVGVLPNRAPSQTDVLGDLVEMANSMADARKAYERSG